MKYNPQYEGLHPLVKSLEERDDWEIALEYHYCVVLQCTQCGNENSCSSTYSEEEFYDVIEF